MKHKLILLYSWLIRLLLIWLPDQPIIMRGRGLLYGLFMKNSGTNFQVSSSSILRTLEKISVGNDVYLAPNTIVSAGGGVTLGNEVMLGFASVIVSGNHTCVGGSYRFGPSELKSVKVSFGTWIGANCTIVGGAHIPMGCLIAANSVVVNKIENSGIYGGVPVKLIRKSAVE
jgi:acetyltransferase-like isoleucine patch superfamily enzyme